MPELPLRVRLRKAFLWTLAIAVVFCCAWSARANAASGADGQALSQLGAEPVPSGGEMGFMGPMPQGAGMQPMPQGGGMQGGPMPQGGGMQPPPGGGMQGGPMPQGGGMPPGPPPNMSSASYVSGPSAITVGGVMTLAVNALILCCGLAFALWYHRGIKSF